MTDLPPKKLKKEPHHQQPPITNPGRLPTPARGRQVESTSIKHHLCAPGAAEAFSQTHCLLSGKKDQKSKEKIRERSFESKTSAMTGEHKDSAPSAGGAYSVREDGLEFQHMPQDLPPPKDGQEFLARFR